MAPRKSSRKGKAQVVSEELPIPTEEQWGKMMAYASFIISDKDDNIYKFMRGQTATILPHHCPPGVPIANHEYWVAKIREIRGVIHDDSSNDVWAKVQWYYSPQDVASVIKSFDTKACSPYERILSDHVDIVSTEAFNEIVLVHELKDDDITQTFIDSDSFHMRYSIDRDSRRLKPKPGADSCTCHKPYRYEDAAIMHFCPRPSCRKWFHQSCLVDAKSKAPNLKDRARQLLTTSPLDDSHVQLFDLSPRPAKRRKSNRGKRNSKVEEEEDTMAVLEALSPLPRELLQVAEQPIVRGSQYPIGGVSGNVKPVVRARQLVYEVLGGSDLPDDWEEMVLGEVTPITLDDAIVRMQGKGSLPPLLCPQCQSAI